LVNVYEVSNSTANSRLKITSHIFLREVNLASLRHYLIGEKDSSFEVSAWICSVIAFEMTLAA
jgi:hypothetical protein